MQLVSTIVPTFNSAETIDKCLKSINDQKYLKEIIVVDNFSTDQTVQIAKKFTRFVFKKGPERSAQRNFGAQKAKGEWLLFVDADMELTPKVIENALASASKNRLDAIIIPEKVRGGSFWAKCLALEKELYRDRPETWAARFFKKESFNKLGGYDENLIAGEDWDLHLRSTGARFRIGKIPNPIYNIEKNTTLVKILKKKYYYAKNIKNYARKHPSTFLLQANFISRLTNSSAVVKMVKNPTHAAGLIFLKSAQAAVALAAQL